MLLCISSVWEFTAWGKATKFDPDLSSSRSVPPSPKKKRTSICLLVSNDDGFQFGVLSSDVIQVEAGWGGSTSLSSTGQVSVWWPKYDTLDPTPPVETPTGSSQITVGVTLSDEERFVLPDLPRERGEEEDKIGRIACGDSFLVALTEKGEVWTAWLGGTVEEIGQMTNGHGRQVWEHVRSSFRGRPREVCSLLVAFEASSIRILKRTLQRLPPSRRPSDDAHLRSFRDVLRLSSRLDH